jgi:GT2 family glycosyltransferase
MRAQAPPEAGLPDVSIVIVSWNVREMLRDCLKSIEAHRGSLDCEIIVVDNRSGDGSAEMVRRDFPDAVLVENALNAGFARGNNQGFALAKGRHVFILNPDTLLVDDSLARLVRILDENPRIGAAGPLLCYPDGEVQAPCARRFPSLGHALTHELLGLNTLPLLGGWVRRSFQGYSYDSSQAVEALCGAAMLVRREVLAQLGGFGQSFVHCGEDLDLCYRIHRAGWETWYQHDCRVVHFGGQSSNQVPLWSTVNSLLSYGEYFARCGGPLQSRLYRVFLLLFWAPNHLVRGALKLLAGRESPERLRQRWRAVRAVVAGRSL